MAIKKLGNLDSIHNFDGIVAFAENAKAIDVFCSMASKMHDNIAIRQLVIYHRKDIKDIFEKHIRQFSRFELINSNFPVYRIQRTFNKENKFNGVIAIIPSGQDNISRILTVSQTGFWEHVVRRLAKKYLYPDAIPVYFKQNEIAEAFTKLEQSLPEGHSIYLSDLTSRQERESQGLLKQKDFDTNRRWTDVPWRSAFTHANETNQWFMALKFKIKKQLKKISTVVATGKIHKHGEIQLDYYYELINQNLTSLLEQRASERMSLLQDRGIKERNYQPSAPLEIAFDFNAFESIEDIREFGKIMSEYPNSGKAVFHGNPYYHANIADFKDGSSFEVWVLNPEKVMIIPQAKSSAEAFERLISYIFAKFHEGKVNEYNTAQ